MTTADTQLAQLDAWLAANPITWSTPRTDLDFEDEETLRRSRSGMSRAARREQRRPRIDRPSEPWADSLAACNPHAHLEAS
jgi:hypothetical protein